MKTSHAITIAALVAVVAAGTMYFVEVDQTQEAELPNVDVTIEGGQAPDYDITTGSVDVESKEKEVLVPKIILEEETVTVPDVEVKPAE